MSASTYQIYRIPIGYRICLDDVPPFEASAMMNLIPHTRIPRGTKQVDAIIRGQTKKKGLNYRLQISTLQRASCGLVVIAV